MLGGRTAGETEVENLHASVAKQKDVVRLEIAVDEPLVVRRGESAGDLHRAVGGSANRQRPLCEAIAERLAVEQFHHGVGAGFVRPDVEDREDVRMRQRRDGLALALEPREAVPVAGKRSGRDFDRHEAIEPWIARFVDFAHPAGADDGHDLVRTEACAGRKRQRVMASSPVILVGTAGWANWKKKLACQP